MIHIALAALVVMMMVAIGLEVRAEQLLEGLHRTRWVVGAIVLNIIVFPVAAWGQTRLLDLSPGMATGILLCAAAPAGPIGPALARLSKANLALSTGLMVLLGVIGLASTPITIALSASGGGGSGVGGGERVVLPMFGALFVFQILPLVVAMAAAHWSPRIGDTLASPFRLLGNVLLVGIVAALLIQRGEILWSTPASAHLGLVGGLLILLAPTLGRCGPAALIRSLLIVTAVRNMSVALLLAARFYDSPEVEAAILVWSFWMLVIPAVVGWVAGRWRTPMVQLGQLPAEPSQQKWLTQPMP